MRIDERSYVPGVSENAALNEDSLMGEDVDNQEPDNELYTLLQQSEFAPAVSL
jgi:hypothetical protein